MSKDSKWLLAHAAIVTSQLGEDGIVAKILEVIGVRTGWCVEFGAWDGKHLSNTYDLIANKGFSAVLIEGGARRFKDLVAMFGGNDRVKLLNTFVGFTPADSLDAILTSTPIPKDFDVLSIDIDGNDYHVWKAVQTYRPKLVVIEYNPTVPSVLEFVQPADLGVNQGASIRSMALLAREKGYELVSATDYNCFFVRSELFPLFEIADNSVEAIRPNENLVTYLFNGMDGTVFIGGRGVIEWHGIPYRPSKVQHISRLFRRFPDTYGPVMRRVAKYYRSVKKRGLP